MSDSTTIPTEAEVRALRDRVYGHPSSDRNWEGCRENWMRPEAIRMLQKLILEGGL